VASVVGLVGDLATAEDAVQDACVAALEQWMADGPPPNPRAWLIAVARNKALDRVRRERRRREKELAATLTWSGTGASGPEPTDTGGRMPGESRDAGGRSKKETGDGVPDGTAFGQDDELHLIFMCCHPALDPVARIALTLRSVCGLSTAEVAAVLVVPEATMAKRLTRTRRKIRDAGIPFRLPPGAELAERLDAVLRVVYLVFTEGHKARTGSALVRGELCDAAVRLARQLHRLLPRQPECAGLLALLLLTDARRPARVNAAGELVLLADQDRAQWNRDMIAEGEALLEAALRAGQPGAYQLHAAIAACHSTAERASDTDWRQVCLLYGELLRYEPTPVILANRAIAVAMAKGPSAGLTILDAVREDPRLRAWPQLHLARADLLRRMDRPADAADAYRTALELDPTDAERAFIARRLDQLTGLAST
jgi:RNA polymerase sigma-70 factor (ECF subfamily)